MYTKGKSKKISIFLMVLIFVFTSFTFSPSANASGAKAKSDEENTTSSVFWSTRDMLGTVPPNTTILHEQYPNTFSRYSLDAPLNLKVYDKTPWWKPNVVKRVEDAANTWSLNRILTVIADFGFSLVKLLTTFSIYAIQIAMGAQWASSLFALFGAITKVIGVTLVTKNLFYLAMICLGGYLLYQGLWRRKLGTTLGETALSIVLLAFTMVFILNPAKVMGGINSGTDLLGTWILQIAVSQDSAENINDAMNDGNYVSNTNIDNEVTESTSLSDLKNNAIIQVTNKLWALQVRAPWDILQFGKLDVNVSNPAKPREDGGVKIHEYEVDAILKILENNSVEIGDGVSSDKPDAEKLKAKGIYAGASWGDAILGLSAGESELRSIMLSVLGNKGIGDGKGEAVSMHESAVEALNDGGTKIFVVLVLIATTALTTVFICTIAMGLFLAQVLILIAMVIGPFILMLSALPQFGHRYIKNWALITLGAFGTKIIYFTLMAIMFLLMSVLMTLAFDISQLGLDQATKDQLSMFSADGTTSLLLVQVLIILMMYGLVLFKKKMFQKNSSGSFGVAGALIHNTEKGGNWGNSMGVLRESLQGQSYGQHVVGSRENRKFNKDMSHGTRKLNNGQDSDNRDKENANTYGNTALAGAEDNQHKDSAMGQEGLNDMNNPYSELTEGQHMEEGEQGTSMNPYQGPDSSRREGEGSDSDDYEFGNGTVSSKRQSGNSQDQGLNCPISGAVCSNEGVAYGNGSSMCSVTGKVCPYRNMAETDHYGKMMQLRRQRDTAQNASTTHTGRRVANKNLGEESSNTPDVVNTPRDRNTTEPDVANVTQNKNTPEPDVSTSKGVDPRNGGVVISGGTVIADNISGNARVNSRDNANDNIPTTNVRPNRSAQPDQDDAFLTSRGRQSESVNNGVVINGGTVNGNIRGDSVVDNRPDTDGPQTKTTGPVSSRNPVQEGKDNASTDKGRVRNTETTPPSSSPNSRSQNPDKKQRSKPNIDSVKEKTTETSTKETKVRQTERSSSRTANPGTPAPSSIRVNPRQVRNEDNKSSVDPRVDEIRRNLRERDDM